MYEYVNDIENTFSYLAYFSNMWSHLSSKTEVQIELHDRLVAEFTVTGNNFEAPSSVSTNLTEVLQRDQSRIRRSPIRLFASGSPSNVRRRHYCLFLRYIKSIEVF